MLQTTLCKSSDSLNTPINFGMPTQLNAPNTARQLSRATMHFDGLQFNHQFPRRSSMLGQLNLVSSPRSPPLNTLINAPLALNPQQAHINVTAPPSPVLNPAPPHFPLIPPAFCFPSSPPHALPLHATNPMANFVNLLPHSPPAPLISSANVFTSINSSTTHTKDLLAPKSCPYNPRTSCSSRSKCLAFSGSSPI